MLGGLLLILAGILVYLHPRIIVALASGLLVAGGMTLVLWSWRLRRLYRTGQQAGSAWTRFMIRF